jgi:putative DNA primase/helicase
MAIHDLTRKADYFKLHLDSNQDELPILGGRVINLQSGDIRKRTINDLWSCELPVTYLDQESHPHTERFMRGICNYPDDPNATEEQKQPAKDMEDFHQQRGGYFLTGHTTARKFWGDFGAGMNGKSALFDLFKSVLGPLYLVAHKSLLIKSESSRGTSQGPETEKVALKNPPKRLAIFQETKAEDVLDINQIKALVDVNEIWISARDLHQKAGKGMEFRVYAKLCIATNNMLKFDRVPGDDGGVDRSENVHWPVRFAVTQEEVNEKTAKGGLCRLADRKIVSDLKNRHLSEFFSWLVKGAMKWYQNDQVLPCPSQVRDATRTMLQENDKIQKFIDECCEIGAGFEVTVASIRLEYESWCQDGGSDVVLTKNKFSATLTKDKGFWSGHDRTGKSRIYKGIKLI